MYSIMYSVKHLTNSTKTYRGTYYIEDVDGNIVAHGSVGGNSHQRRVYLRKHLRDLNRKKCVLPNTINVEEEKALSQFIHDGTVGSTNNTNTDMDIISVEIHKFVESKRKPLEPGDIIISAELTLNGGNVSFYQMSSLISRSDTYEILNNSVAGSLTNVVMKPLGNPKIEPYSQQAPCYINDEHVYFVAASLDSVLIEPLGYPEIEPYNRQSPYYIGDGYAQLNKHVTDKFSVYTSVHDLPENQPYQSIRTSFVSFYYNNFWGSVRLGLAINREDVSDFITTLFGMMYFGDDVSNIVDVYTAKLISTYVDKSELNKG